MIGICPECGEFLIKKRMKRFKAGLGIIGVSAPLAITGIGLPYSIAGILIGAKTAMSKLFHRYYCKKCKTYHSEDSVWQDARDKKNEEVVRRYKK